MRVWTLMLMFLVYGLVCTQFSLAAEPREEDHEELRSLMKNVVAAMNERNVPLLMDSLADDFSVTTVDQQTLTSAQQLKDYFEKSFNAPDSLVTDMKIAPEADVLTKFTGVSSGYCYGDNLETYTMRDGRKVEMKSRWTATLVKNDGQWKIAAVHAGVNFLDNPLVHKLGSAVTRSAVFGFLGGAVVVFLIGFVLIRVKSGRK